MVIALFITDNKMAETLKAYARQYEFLTLIEQLRLLCCLYRREPWTLRGCLQWLLSKLKSFFVLS